MRHSMRLLGNATAFDTPLCWYEPHGTCPAIFESPINCTPTFNVCADGWTCTYLCTNNKVYNTYSHLCQDLVSCQKSMRYDL
eukprot:08797.XXX_544785_545030_1 [CDS] Oithona nana genome sequencing.